MDHQTHVNGKGSNGATTYREVRSSMADLASDIVSLLELQWELFELELSNMRKRAVMPLLLLVLGMIVGLGTVPVLVACLGLLFVNVFEISIPVGLFLGGLCAAFVAFACLAWGWRGCSRRLKDLDCSRAELRRNLTWFKRAVRLRSTKRRHPMAHRGAEDLND